MGFCFGGTYAFELAVRENKNPENKTSTNRLAACIVFYGQPPNPLSDVEYIGCPVLGLYGEKDERLMKSLPELEEAMAKYHKDFTFKVYKNTGHAFFNDTNKYTYNEAATTDSWSIALEFLRKNLS
jgi:carboxymethylenebutenolidase